MYIYLYIYYIYIYIYIHIHIDSNQQHKMQWVHADLGPDLLKMFGITLKEVKKS